MTVPASFRAFRIHGDGGHRAGIETITLDDLAPGEVVVKAAYSSVNYKDALANACAATRYRGAVAPLALREAAWARLARDLDAAKLDAITTQIGLDDAIGGVANLLAGRVRGRVVVQP